jgi:hypothetical protein
MIIYFANYFFKVAILNHSIDGIEQSEQKVGSSQNIIKLEVIKSVSLFIL